MKKVVCLFMVLSVIILLAGCVRFYGYQIDTKDGFDIGYSNLINDAFVSAYNWDGTEEKMNIVIPEKYDGMPITALGGYHSSGLPDPFAIELSEAYKKELCGEANQWVVSSIYADIGSVETVYFDFNIHISKNIGQINTNMLGKFYEGCYFDGDDYQAKIIVVFLYTITCDDENKTFYARDGKLYYRESDELVSGIFYFDHDFTQYSLQ
ncbi:MAG: hypothetical protein IJ388_02530 [Oscillospiraceae bacterium]|nr:hypothetical protein [Oscillospiraceae bacterium]